MLDMEQLAGKNESNLLPTENQTIEDSDKMSLTEIIETIKFSFESLMKSFFADTKDSYLD